MQPVKFLGVTAALLAAATSAQAALVDRGGGMIYDTTLNITWLADMNHAYTSGYAAANAGGSGSNTVEANGRMGWDAANTWASNLIWGGYDDWRLASVKDRFSDATCSSFGGNCTGGELSHLFVADLGNRAPGSVFDQTGDTAEQIANFALFSNVQRYVYWSGLERAGLPAFAWYFDTGGGWLDSDSKSTAMYAVAVRDGDVAVAVPEPQSFALALMALAAATLARRKRPL